MQSQSALSRSRHIFQQNLEEDPLLDEQLISFKHEINDNRNFLSQSSLQHENRLNDIRLSYDSKLHLAKQSAEEEIKSLHDRLWSAKHSLDQEKQLHLTRTHRFTITKLESSEKLDSHQEKLKSLTKQLLFLEEQDFKAHKSTISALQADFESVSKSIRNERREKEEEIAEKSYRLNKNLEEKERVMLEFSEEKQELVLRLKELEDENEGRMKDIEKELRSSHRKIENHEGRMEVVLGSPIEENIKRLTGMIGEKEERLRIAKEKNEALRDKLLRLEKNLYGKSK